MSKWILLLLLARLCAGKHWFKDSFFDDDSFENDYDDKNFGLGPNFGSNLGDAIQAQVKQALDKSGVTTLPQRLEQQNIKFQQTMNRFQENLSRKMQDLNEKLAAKDIENKMMTGVGGYTIITYGNNKSYYVRNGVLHGCRGHMQLIDNRRLVCSRGFYTIEPEQESPCMPVTISSKSVVNDHVCMGRDISFSSYSNGIFTCQNGRLYTPHQIMKQCGPDIYIRSYAQIVYIPSPEDRRKIPFPNPNKYIKCENPPTERYCIFSVDYMGIV